MISHDNRACSNFVTIRNKKAALYFHVIHSRSEIDINTIDIKVNKVTREHLTLSYSISHIRLRLPGI